MDRIRFRLLDFLTTIGSMCVWCSIVGTMLTTETQRPQRKTRGEEPYLCASVVK